MPLIPATVHEEDLDIERRALRFGEDAADDGQHVEAESDQLAAREAELRVERKQRIANPTAGTFRRIYRTRADSLQDGIAMLIRWRLELHPHVRTETVVVDIDAIDAL